MDDDGDAGLVHPRPERIEGRSVGGRWPDEVVGAAGRMTIGPGAPVERPLELADGEVEVGEREVRGGEDAVAGAAKPQSSSSHRLKPRNITATASGS